ncbi:MAG: hypothetical protein ACRCT1_20275 [Microcoleaceae cyanobacterium]
MILRENEGSGDAIALPEAIASYCESLGEERDRQLDNSETLSRQL